jgi:hypothetical protein
MAILFLALYLAVIIVRPMDWRDSFMYGWRLVDFTAILTLFGAFTAYPRVLNEHMRFTQIPQVAVSALLLIAASLSWLYPFYGSAIVYTFTTFGKTVLLFAAILLLGRHPNTLQTLKWVLMLSVAFLAVHGILQVYPEAPGTGFGGQRPIWRLLDKETGEGVWQIRAFGIFNDPNDLCLMFVAALPLLYAQFKATPNFMQKGFCLSLMTLIGYAAWLTNSRGGIVAIGGMIAAYLIVRARGTSRWILLGIAIFGITFLAPSRFAGPLKVDVGRLNAWGDGLAAFQQYPIFGVGFGQFRDYTDDYIPAHNSFIEALTELGLFGYIPWFLLIYLTMLYLRRTIRLKDQISREEFFYLSGLFSSLVGYLTGAYFLSRAYREPLYVLLAFAAAQVITACYEKNLYAQVFGNWRKDMRNGAIWALASIIIIWVSVRVANTIGR